MSCVADSSYVGIWPGPLVGGKYSRVWQQSALDCMWPYDVWVLASMKSPPHSVVLIGGVCLGLVVRSCAGVMYGRTL